ncbi:hypothetical protein [Lacipirellula sp.]|uniref:hypothetical protein n=1 Tax=Lacipirellula sp. TaxID=2691419 RepID=UPI003D0C7B98
MNRRRFRFSLAKLLAAITLVALLAATWQLVFYRHPTYFLGLYEKAPSTRNGSIAVGPNRIEIEYLARNERDGSIRYADGLGSTIKATSPNAQRLKDAGPWLDLVEIALAPGDAVDVIEFRAFNHETREFLFAGDGYGWALKSPNVVQLYGFKKPLPPKLDLWFRTHSYALPVQEFKLPAAVGAECKFPYGTVRVEDLQPGNWSTVGAKLLRPLDPDAPTTTAVLSWDVSPAPASERYQITAVAADGRRGHTHLLNYISFRMGASVFSETPRFNMPIDEVDHFILQPFGGLHRFFFEGVELPAISAKPLAAPPVVAVDVNGQEIERRLADFDPVEVVVSTRRGDSFEGASAGGSQAWLIPREGGPIDVDDSFSVTYEICGYSAQPRFRFFDATSNQPIPASQLPERSSTRASGAAEAAGGFSYGIPLDELKSIEMTLGP